MKFNKESYKRAMNHIDNEENLKKKIAYTNQKYKADILSGRRAESDMTGWNGSDEYYDNEMLRTMGHKRFMRLLAMLAIGVVLAVVMGVVTGKDIYLRMYGEKETACYVKNAHSLFWECYEYSWLEADYPEEYPQRESGSDWGYTVRFSASSIFYEKNGDTMTLYFLKNKGEPRKKLRPAINRWLLCGGNLIVLVYLGFCIRGLVRNAKERKGLDYSI